MSIPYKTTGQLTYTSKVNDVVTDADTIEVEIYKPDGTSVGTSTPTSGGTGINNTVVANTTLDVIGQWFAVYIWTSGTSTHFDVEPFWVTSLLEPTSSVRLCTLEQVKRYPNMTNTNQQIDERISDLIAAMTETVNKKYEREFVPQLASTARTFEITRRYTRLTPYDLRAASIVKIHPEDDSPTTLTAGTDYQLRPVGGDNLTNTFRGVQLGINVDMSSTFSSNFGFAQLEITGNWGIWATESDIPENVRWAAIQTVLSWFDRQSSEIATVAEFTDGRQTMPSMGGTWSIPNTAHEIFKRYKEPTEIY